MEVADFLQNFGSHIMACKFKNRSGFTLVELLVVIAIIGILVGMLLNGLGRDVPLVHGARLTQVNVGLEHSQGYVIAIPLLLALLIHGSGSGARYMSFRQMLGRVPIPLSRLDISTRHGRIRLSLLIDYVVANAPLDRISVEDRSFLETYSLRLDHYILLREDALASPSDLLILENQQMQDFERMILILRGGDYLE
jgi:prepilin-type N-terminal cleavage/methylation domain-containing protein